FLHLPQKQKFKAGVFLERKVVTISKAAVVVDEFGHGRISVLDASTVEPGQEFTDWTRFLHWNPAAALERVRAHEPGPLDLEVELQEELVLTDWQIQEPLERPEEQQVVYPIVSGATVFDAIVSKGIDGKSLRDRLEGYRKK